MADRLDFQLLSLGLRRMAWIRFWIQTALGIVVMGLLIFNNIGGRLSREANRALGLSPGLSLTTLAFLVLLFSLLGLLCTDRFRKRWTLISAFYARMLPIHLQRS